MHGDLKPDNILIKETSRNIYSGKLIDFDDSYFSEEPPTNREGIVGTPEYYSPELAAYIMDEDEELKGTTLSLASDIFTLGIIFCEYFTGDKPITDSSVPIWAAVTNGSPLSFSRSLNPSIESLLRSMLSLKASDRPSIKKIHILLREIKNGIADSGTGRERSGLRIGRGFEKLKSDLSSSNGYATTSLSSSTSKSGILRRSGLKTTKK